MKLLARIIVRIAWWLPGRPHMWARRLMIERAAMEQAVKAAEYRNRNQ